MDKSLYSDYNTQERGIVKKEILNVMRLQNVIASFIVVWCEEEPIIWRVFIFCHSYINRESDMVNTVFNHGPLTVAVDATSWQDYVSGVIQHHCSAQADNHAVQVIGFDTSGESS